MVLETGTVILAVDETDIMLFPPLGSAWGRRGEPVIVPISGRNEKGVLFGAINIRTGHRLLTMRPLLRHPDFMAFLTYIRSHYCSQRIALLLDEHPAHTTPNALMQARRLNIRFIWLPHRSPHLNPMDQLWRRAKGTVSANVQYNSLQDHIDAIISYFYSLSNNEALRQSGLLSTKNWLRSVL